MKLRKILSAILGVLMLASAIVVTPAVADDTNGEVVSFDFGTVCRAIVNGKDSAILTPNVNFKGKNALKVVPNPNTTDEKTVGSTTYISLDSYGGVSGVDLTKVRYLSIDYYYDSLSVPVDPMQFRIVSNPSGIIKNKVEVYPMEPMVAGQWAVAIFDLTCLETVSNPDIPYLKHFHLRPYGLTHYTEISENDILYIGNMSFHTEKPVFEDHESYMKGYEDGTFRPSGTMTRAEACTTVARIAAGSDELVPTDKTTAFTDISSHWGKKYIAYVESLGYLKSYSGAFLPDQPITRAEFVELVYNMGLLKDAGKPAAFTDVAATHPRYNVIIASAKAGLVNGYDNGNGTFSFKPDNTITRAEVVTVINRARGRDTLAVNVPQTISKIFMDVDREHWAFAGIAEATIHHDASNGKWVSAKEDPEKKLVDTLGGELVYNYSAGLAKVAELDVYEAQRIAEIRATQSDHSRITGKKIYVSSSMGNDANNGLSEATPVKTITKAAMLAKSGDGILFKRGDMWREELYALSGVTYSAYGQGAKPFINASPENGADPSKWTLVHKDNTTGALVWKYTNEDFRDVGTIVLNDGKDGAFAQKVAPNFNGEYFYLKNQEKVPFTYKNLNNLEFFHKADSDHVGYKIDVSVATGPLFLRCDQGNPGSVFESIEFATRTNCIKVLSGMSDILFDNLCLKYSGFYGISLNTGVKNITVQNCEIGWIGGTITSYDYTYPEEPVRLGNGVEIYGAVDGFYVDNNYIYQCYDTGATHQVSGQNSDCRQDNIRYKNNVITECVYSIEYFLGALTNSTRDRAGENFLIEGNLLRRAGEGFGSSRPNRGFETNLRSGTARNEYYNFEIKNNIFDRAKGQLISSSNQSEEWDPVYSGNTYIQGAGNKFYSHSTTKTGMMDLSAVYNTKTELGDESGQVYYVPNIPKWQYSYVPEKTVAVTSAELAAYNNYLANAPKSDTEVVNVSIPVKASEGESTAILDPYFVKTQKTGDLYSYPSLPIDVWEMKEDASGIEYAHIKIENTTEPVVFNCSDLPKITLDGSPIYFKFLMRTNDNDPKSPNPDFSIISTELDRAIVTGIANKAEKPAAQGKWEEVIVKAEDYPNLAGYTQKISLYLTGRNAYGTTFYDEAGNSITPDLYYDLAAWAAFPNYESAKAYDLVKAAGGKMSLAELQSKIPAVIVPEKIDKPKTYTEPTALRTQKDKTLYDSPNKNEVVEKVDAETGIVYSRITIKEADNPTRGVYLDCNGVSPEFDISGGRVYFKVLLRTNDRTPRNVRISIFHAKDETGKIYDGEVGTVRAVDASEATISDGTWQEVIIVNESVPLAAVSSPHIQLRFAGNTRAGDFFYSDGSPIQSDLYYDVAAWAAFKDYDSAEAYDLKAAAKR